MSKRLINKYKKVVSLQNMHWKRIHYENSIKRPTFNVFKKNKTRNNKRNQKKKFEKLWDWKYHSWTTKIFIVLFWVFVKEQLLRYIITICMFFPEYFVLLKFEKYHEMD